MSPSSPDPPATPAGDGRAGPSGWFDALIERAVVVTPAGGVWDASAFAARPGVVAIEDGAGGCAVLACTGDARAFAVKRLDPAGELARGASRASAVRVASGFEADMVYLAIARARMQNAYRQLMERWGLGGVRIDPDAAFPEPGVVRLEDAADVPPACLLAPVARKHAQSLADAVVDAYDLCRYPSILKQAPRGVACAYKEMGRCPAPCDGTEEMSAFRARVREAVDALSCTHAERGAALEGAIRAAAKGHRFEEAAALKKRLERIEALDAPSLRAATRFDRFRCVVVGPSGVGKGARVYAFAGGRLASVADMREADGAVAGSMVGALLAEPVRPPASAAELESMCVLVRWMGAPARRRVRVVRVTGGGSATEVEAAIAGVLRRREPEPEVEEIEHAGG